MSRALAELLRRDGPWADAITRHTGAAQAAQQVGDRLGEANALHELGNVRRLTGDYLGAAKALERGLSIHRDLGDRRGQANSLNSKAALHRVSGDLARAEGAISRPWNWLVLSPACWTRLMRSLA